MRPCTIRSLKAEQAILWYIKLRHRNFKENGNVKILYNFAKKCKRLGIGFRSGLYAVQQARELGIIPDING